MRARVFSWGSGARVELPRWRSVAMIELALAILIIATAAAAMLGISPMLLAKVRMAEALHEMHVGKIDVLEHYAVTGRALPTNALGLESGADVSAVPEYEKHLSAAAAFAAVGSAPRAVGNYDPSLRDGSAYYSRAGVIDGAVVGIGRALAVDRPYRLSFSAADLEGGGPVLLWTCGTAPPPPGYRRVGAPVANDIPPQLLVYECRRRDPW